MPVDITLKKKYYTIFFASDRNQYTRSFGVSKNQIYLVVLFGIIIISFAFIGLLQIVDREKLNRDLNALNNVYGSMLNAMTNQKKK